MAISTELRPDGLWLVLPPRQVPPLIGAGIALFGLVMLVFMVFWIGSAAGWGRGSGSSGFDIARWIFAATGLPGVVAGIGAVVVGAGLALGASRCELGLTRDALLVRERLGRLRWTRGTRLTEVRGIVVPETATIISGLLLRRDRRPDAVFAPGYDRAITTELAALLQRELARAGGPAVAVVAHEGLGPPPGTLHVEEADGRLAIRLAQQRKPWSLLVFAIAWCGVLGFISWRTMAGGAATWGAGLFLLVFWGIGAAMLLGFIHAAGRRLDVLWADGRLTVIDASPLRRRLRSWTRDELADVLLEEHGSGSGRYEAVTIRPRSGRDHEVSQIGDRGAKAWIAGRLRLALQGRDPVAAALEPPPAMVQPAAGSAAADDHAVLPANSPISMVAQPGGVRIELPPRGMLSAGNPLLVGLIVALFGAGFIALVFHIDKAADGRVMASAVCGLFVVIGLALAGHGLRVGTRRTRLTLGHDGLDVVRDDLLGRRNWHLAADQVGAIRVEDSGTRVNDRILWRLAIDGREGTRITCGGECSQAELAAVAARLRTELAGRT